MKDRTVKVHEIPVLDPVHDGRHTLNSNPYARESVPYVVVLREERIVACPYTWVDRDGNAGGIFFLFGEGIGPEPIVEHFANIKLPPSTNFDDWRIGDIYFSQDLNLRNASISVRGKRASLECTFEALHPAYAYGGHERGCPSFLADNRLEQTGRMKGVLTIDGREIPFDTTGCRDHSWGVRDWQSSLHWKWAHMQAGDDLIVHFMEMHALGNVELRGYVVRDGLMAEVESVQTDFEHDDQYLHTAMTSVVRDKAGRTTRLEGRFFGHYLLVPNPQTTLNEGGISGTIDGKPGAGYVEFMWQTAYVEHIRESLRLRKLAAAR
jgi:hypothetical protein